MGISCQRNGHWAATNHLSGRGLVQPMKEKLSSAAGLCAGRGCALIRQLANMGTRLIWAPHQAATVKESISIVSLVLYRYVRLVILYLCIVVLQRIFLLASLFNICVFD